MKQVQRICIISILLCAFTATAGAEYIFLKEGKIVQGTIAGERGGTITLQLEDKSQMLITRDQILRTLYTDEFKNKSLVQLTTGDMFEGFIINETRESYTIRKKLDAPEEYVIPKEDIINISRKRPSRLLGRPIKDGIELKWTKPLGSVKKYLVYLKKEKEDYRVVAETAEAGIEIMTGIELNTLYKIVVRLLDDEGYESLPSNEITVRSLQAGESPKEMKEFDKEKQYLALIGKNATDVKEKTNSSRTASLSIGLFGAGGIFRQTWTTHAENFYNYGGGLLLDTAVAKNVLLNYRLSLSYERSNDFRYTKTSVITNDGGSPFAFYTTKYPLKRETLPEWTTTMTHAIGFGVVRTRLLRFWIGPELLLGFLSHDSENVLGGFFGGGAVAGLNLNFGDYVSLALSADFRFLYAVRYSQYSVPKATGLVPDGTPTTSYLTSKTIFDLDKGWRIGGQLSLGVIFRINDRY